MKYTNNKTIISIRNAKNASLFFDYIIPIDVSEIYREAYNEGFWVSDRKILKNVLPPNLLSDCFVSKGIGTGLCYEFNQFVSDSMKTYPKKFLEVGETEHLINYGSLAKFHKEYFNKMRASFKKVIDKAQISPIEIYGDKLINGDNNDSCPCISLSKLNLIDTDKLTWEKIIEIRKDDLAKTQLRNLRLFIYEHYADKPLSYIEDDILKRIDDYEQFIKSWNVSTIESILKISLSEKALASISVSLGAFLFGAPLSVAAAVGASIHIGKIALEISSKKRELNLFKYNSPIAYITEIRKHAK